MNHTIPTAGWQAHLTLGFQRRGQRTTLGQCAHQGPLQVQRPFYPEGETVCHIAILHPPGGVIGGDELRLDARLDSGAHALLTTPAAGNAMIAPIGPSNVPPTIADPNATAGCRSMVCAVILGANR